MPPRNPHLPASKEALFRYRVVAAVLARVAAGGVRAEAVREAAAQLHLGIDGTLRRVSTRSVYRWLRAWDREGAAGLEPRSRRRTETSKVLPEALLEFLVAEHLRDPEASIPEVLRRARQLGVVAPGERVCRSTVWRAARRMGLDFRRRKKGRDRDARRFRVESRMQLVLADGKHFRSGAGRLRRVALFFLDNATRYGLNAVVGTTETSALFLRGLHEVVGRHGLFDVIYVDGGSGFGADDCFEVVKNLGRALVQGESSYPQAHGEIERFNRTGKAQLLKNWDRNPAIDPACAALELRAKHFLREVYNHTPHQGIDDDTPHQRWHADPRPLRFPDDPDALRGKFRVELSRRVTNDNVVSIDGVAYEVPLGHAGATIPVWRQVLDDRLFVLHEGRSVRIHPVDLVANATSGRARRTAVANVSPPPVPSAADIAYSRDFGAVTGPDGGFTDPNEESP